ncbi:MAG: SGNH/GDSL hydrolase family protein [Opitutaceae bacterium]|jgi:hypothetical protein
MNTHLNHARLLLGALVFGTTINVVMAASEAGAVSAKLKEAFALAKTERLAVIALGDSNQRFGGHGYSRYMSRALGEGFGCYGSDLLVYREMPEKDAPPLEKPPAALAEQAFGYWYVPPGHDGSVSWKNGQIIIPADHPLGVSGNLRFHLYYGTFQGADAGGVFRPVIRRDTPPWTILASGPEPINPVTGDFAIKHFTLDLPASDQRNWQVQFMPVAAGKSVRGPFLASIASCENTDKKAGIAYNTLYAVGGKSVRDMVLKLREGNSTQMDEYIAVVRQPLNGHKTGVVMICSGLNDRNDHGPSLGISAGLDSSSPEGYADNLSALVSELQSAWERTGGTASTLHFAFMPSHALGDPDDAKLAAYRVAAKALAARLPNASSIDLAKLVPYQEMADGKYYDRGLSSGSHLTEGGYAAISQALVNALSQ